MSAGIEQNSPNSLNIKDNRTKGYCGKLHSLALPSLLHVNKERMTAEQNTEDIRKTLIDFNHAIATKDVNRALAVFDTNANVILAGSSIDELHMGNEAIKKFLEKFLSNPFRVSWDLTNMRVGQNDNTAWIFVDGKAIIDRDNGKRTEMPYRITVVMVKKDDTWKWRLFNGSVPEKE